MSTTHRRLDVTLPDGRLVEALAAGSGDRVLVFHDGTPTAAVEFPELWQPAETLGLRVVSWSRPGYAGSTPKPGRAVAEVVSDAEEVLAAFGLGDEDRLVLGWSGGGPHALAHSVLDARCRAVATIGSVAPLTEMTQPAWLAGMGSDNIAEFGAAFEGESALSTWLEPAAAGLAGVTPDGIVAGLGDLVDEVDSAAISRPGVAEHYALAMRTAVSTGIAGWRDDDLAFVKGWGFDLSAASKPVAIWHGSHDLMSPPAHAQRLAELVPTASLHLDPVEGHLSWINRLDEILADLASH